MPSSFAAVVASLILAATHVFAVAEDTQVVMSSSQPTENWSVSVSKEWDVLGPFPIQAREQHFLSPSFPVNLSQPIDYDAKWPSAYADNGVVGWSKATMQKTDLLEVSFPEIRWSSLRATEGWAALQHHTVLRTTLTVSAPAHAASEPWTPNLLVSITQGSFFTVLPRGAAQEVPQWYMGNIYAMAAAPPHAVPLPAAPRPGESTTYDLFVSGDYEIRLFGDPVSQGSEVPTLSIGVGIGIEMRPQHALLRPIAHDVVPDFVDGWAFGDAIGVGLRSSGGWWTVKDVKIRGEDVAKKVNVRLLEETRLAPTQTRRVSVVLEQADAFTGSALPVEFTVESEDGVSQYPVDLPVKQLPKWTAADFAPVITTHFEGATAMAFVAVPPKEPDAAKALPPLLFLHGAGLNVLTMGFWHCAPPRQAQSWLILPTGRTEWGLDWHGPSTVDAWASVAALAAVLRGNPRWRAWAYPADTRVVLLGHSNGGQGAWHVAGRFPERVLGLVPVAAYSKSQSYVPLVQSRSAHFVDPALRAILESSFTPDDNDLFLSNLVDTPVLAIHGGADDNVPVWHSRALVDTLKTWNAAANVSFREDPGEPHCYFGAFNHEGTQAFIDQALQSSDVARQRSKSFTLTVAVPFESGSLHGCQILTLETPGRLARLTVTEDEGVTKVFTKNVQAFSVQMEETYLLRTSFNIDGQAIAIPQNHTPLIFTLNDGLWALTTDETYTPLTGRMSAILTSPGALQLVVPSNDSRALSAATRLAHALLVYHALDTTILPGAVPSALGPANAIFITNSTDPVLAALLAGSPTPFALREGTLTLRGRALPPGAAALFLHPHPTTPEGLVLVVYADGAVALERALRLVPVRTGVAVPDWVVVGPAADATGAGGVLGAGVYGNNWAWNTAMSAF